VVARFDPTLRRLVGYGVYNGLIGHIDKRSPEQLLDGDGAGHAMVWDRS
jgi:ectoine hydroxylase-related dioxygenase (phytanoyl-CoA dioxygenase family)